MPFDAAWFNELRELSDERLRDTRERGIDGYVPHVGELRRDEHVSTRFLDETLTFVRVMSATRYRFDTFFRAYEQHLFNFPKGRAFRKQWNIGFTAGTGPDEDQVRIGVGFRLSAHENAHGIEYLEFLGQVHERKEAFDQLCHELGNYYEFWEPEGQSVFEAAPGPLSLTFLRDEPPLNAWRFFGRCLRVCDPQDRAVICSHELLQSAVVDVCDRIQNAGFGM